MTIFNTLRTALRGITGNKLRAGLTTLGIIIGAASVITMLALGNGARAAVEANFRYLGADHIQIYPFRGTGWGRCVCAGIQDGHGSV